jgi:GNAT superfamily N-acetyltransferase
VIISVREHPEYYKSAVDYFTSCWGLDRKIYEDSISDSLTTDNPLPRWYLILRSESGVETPQITGGLGLIENDFMVRKDLKPWLSSLYVVEAERGKSLGAKLLSYGRKEAAKLGFERLYLRTHHVEYYEKYDWQFFGMEESEWGQDTRVYTIETNDTVNKGLM